jgi:hypothetical protein
MNTKADIINGAYSLMRISGITVNPSGNDLTLALERLEDMAAEFEGRNIVTDYNFELAPETTSLHNLQRKYWFAYKANLAVRLLPDFGKQPNPILLTQQQSSFSFLSGDTAPHRESTPSPRMPIGSGNALRRYRWNRYYRPEAEAPLSAETMIMYIDDIKSFTESFSAYLDAGETIASYTIIADIGLTISNDSNTDELVIYTITATGRSDGSQIGLLQVKIVVTTSAGRIETRIINFSLLQSDVINN